MMIYQKLKKKYLKEMLFGNINILRLVETAKKKEKFLKVILMTVMNKKVNYMKLGYMLKQKIII